MAIVPLHRRITADTLRQAGFSERAAELAAEANAAVDKKQGSDAAESNLHAMAGFIPDPVFNLPKGRLQNEDEARTAVERRLADARTSIVAKVLAREFEKALRELGEALHTVQDRAFHSFEAWPYDGIATAIAEDPNYMFAHGVRDLGGISRLDLRTADGALRYGAEWTFPFGRDTYLSVHGFGEQGANAMGARVPGSVGMDTPRGHGGLLTLTFGAAPGSVPSHRALDTMAPGPAASPVQSMLTQGPDARRRASTASRDLVEQIAKDVAGRDGGTRAWKALLAF